MRVLGKAGFAVALALCTVGGTGCEQRELLQLTITKRGSVDVDVGMMISGARDDGYAQCDRDVDRMLCELSLPFGHNLSNLQWSVSTTVRPGWTWVGFEGDCADPANPARTSALVDVDCASPGTYTCVMPTPYDRLHRKVCTAVAVPAQPGDTDGGTPDGGTPDAGELDGGTSADAGTVDGGTGPVTLTVDPSGGVVTLLDTDEVYYKRFESAGSITVPAGTQLTLRADPFTSQQKTFSAWSGTVAGCSGTGTELELTLNASGSCNPAYAP